jgi:hypothetical protein
MTDRRSCGDDDAPFLRVSLVVVGTDGSKQCRLPPEGIPPAAAEGEAQRPSDGGHGHCRRVCVCHTEFLRAVPCRAAPLGGWVGSFDRKACLVASRSVPDSSQCDQLAHPHPPSLGLESQGLLHLLSAARAALSSPCDGRTASGPWSGASSLSASAVGSGQVPGRAFPRRRRCPGRPLRRQLGRPARPDASSAVGVGTLVGDRVGTQTLVGASVVNWSRKITVSSKNMYSVWRRSRRSPTWPGPQRAGA